MPGFSAPVLKPCTASPDPKRKNSNNQKQPRVLRTIHVIYSDPDATDSSSDDEHGTCHGNNQHDTHHGVKRCVKAIQMLESVALRQNVLNQNGMRSTTSKYVGVRQRKTGRWVAEIRDPIHNVRHWLGTYNTEEEAHLAYEKKRLEFQALLVDPKRVKPSFAARKVARSPSSVLDVLNITSHGSDRNANEIVNRDCNTKEAKEEKFEIKDEMKPGLKIIFDELKEEDFLMCNLGDLADLENSSALLDLDMEDFSWLDEVLKYCGFEAC